MMTNEVVALTLRLISHDYVDRLMIRFKL